MLVGLLVGESTGGGVAVDVGVRVGVEVGAVVGVDACGTVGVAVRIVTVVTVPPVQPATRNSMTKAPAIDTARRRADSRITQPSRPMLEPARATVLLSPIQESHSPYQLSSGR